MEMEMGNVFCGGGAEQEEEGRERERKRREWQRCKARQHRRSPQEVDNK